MMGRWQIAAALIILAIQKYKKELRKCLITFWK